jgi:hypothetical protein
VLPNPPPMPAVSPQIPPKLRPVKHPNMSELLTHFCIRNGRPQPNVCKRIKAMNAPQRLDNILQEGKLWVFPTFSGGDPAFCLTEATVEGLSYLVTERRHQPWGLVFERQSVYDAGGSPVWYVRNDEYYKVRSQVDTRCQAWMVRLEPYTSDWLEEREWRIPVAPVPVPQAKPFGVIPLDRLRVHALLVGGLFFTRPTAAEDSLEYLPSVPAAARGIPHWIWNGRTFVEWRFPP